MAGNRFEGAINNIKLPGELNGSSDKAARTKKAEEMELTDNTHKEYDANVTKHTHITNKSKHYDKRGKREERYALLLDKQLKEDLRLLANATGSRSVNDFIITILIEYVDEPKRQEVLRAYKELLNMSE